jgi:hypothetical protein
VTRKPFISKSSYNIDRQIDSIDARNERNFLDSI